MKRNSLGSCKYKYGNRTFSVFFLLNKILIGFIEKEEYSIIPEC